MMLKKCIFVLPFFMTACAGIYGESFDCPPGEGVACKSISEVNRMIDKGEIGQKKGEHSTPESVDRLAHSSLPLLPSASSFSEPASHAIIRRPEQVMRVWVAPHLEDSGSYVGETYLYTVVEPGVWVERPPTKPLPSSSVQKGRS